MSLFFSEKPVRLAVDAAMAAGFVVSLAFRLTGGGPHEIIGLGVCVLFVLHCLLNAHWFTTWNKGRYDFRRTLGSALNFLLIICMVLLCLTGLMNSRHLLGFLQPEGGMAVRQLHSFAAYWGMVFVGVHAGIHWQKVMTGLRGIMRVQTSVARARFLRVLALLFAVYGVWASNDRDMGAKLFQGFAFDFWDPARPSILFYTHNFAIIGLYVWCAHYGLKLIRALAHCNIGVRPPLADK